MNFAIVAPLDSSCTCFVLRLKCGFDVVDIFLSILGFPVRFFCYTFVGWQSGIFPSYFCGIAIEDFYRACYVICFCHVPSGSW